MSEMLIVNLARAEHHNQIKYRLHKVFKSDLKAE